MKCAAPGKLLLSGAYAVLEGAPAIAVAVNRFAIAHDGDGEASREAREAMTDAPAVDVRALAHDGKKLGLGSSAAALVASIALRAAESEEDIESHDVRARIFATARGAHARAQSGGSGVDVAVSTFGGVLRYTLRGARFERAEHEPVALPAGVRLAAFFAGTSARTSDLRAKVDALKARDARVYAARMGAIADAARGASDAIHAADPRAFVESIALAAPALGALGADADAPIVTPAQLALSDAAREERAAFVPSGAGGGDAFVFVGIDLPSSSFLKRAGAIGMTPLELAIEPRGVRVITD